MTASINPTGQWRGHYLQHDRARAIVAEWHHAGERLTGTMHDLDPACERSVFEMAVEAGLPPGEEEQIIAWLRAQFPDAPGVPIRSVTHLPPISVLEGTVRGRTVYFRKTYEGERFSGYRVGDRYVGVTIALHVVYYSGQLSDAGTHLEGRWWIQQAPEHGGHRTEGGFVLRRQPERAEAPLAAEG